VSHPSRRLLVVGQTFPWPEVTGGRMRLANVIQALSRLGEVDLFAFVDGGRTDRAEVPDGARVHRVEIVARRHLPFQPLRRVQWMIAGRAPRPLAVLDVREAQQRFAAWLDGPYDLVWFHHVETHAVLGSQIDAPSVVDFDDLEDQKLHARLAGGHEMGRPERDIRLWFRWAGRLQDERDRRLWQELQRSVAARVRSVVVCSDEDRRRLGAANCAVIPNGYPAPAQPLGRVSVGQPAVILFAGLLTYPPNRDAAALLVQRIAPLIRARIPAAQVRLVGQAPESLRRLADPPRVVVTGFVPDITAELARADLVAAPLRSGGGTRIKILEAFAHRIPVVSTTSGAAGLDVVSGREILIADTPEAFARACVTLLMDRGQRLRLAEAAQQLFLRRYRWDHIHDAIAALAEQVARAAVPA